MKCVFFNVLYFVLYKQLISNEYGAINYFLFRVLMFVNRKSSDICHFFTLKIVLKTIKNESYKAIKIDSLFRSINWYQNLYNERSCRHHVQ